MRRATKLVLIAAAFGCLGCPSRPSESCSDVALIHEQGLSSGHTANCSDPTCGNGTNPPSGGLHCFSWLECRRHDVAQPRCNWIHNLEHGHLVFAYNCPT